MEKLIIKYEKNPLKVNLRKLINLRVSLNDLLYEYLNNKNCVQNFRSTDIRIIVGFISSILASITTYISLFYEFQDIKKLQIFLLSFYFCINGLYELYSKFVANYTYYGNMNGKSLIIYSYIDDYYRLEVVYNGKYKKYKALIYDLFYENGILDHSKFLGDLNDLFDFKES